MLDGTRIRQLRERRGLSQAALGALIHKDGQYVSKVELGLRTSITTGTLEALARALGCTPDYLLGWSDTLRPRGRVATVA
jgi:transcriptional regulator with XRE-family HTH domain